MASESIGNRVNSIDDPETLRAMNAVLQSILIDLNAIKAAYNGHTHTGGVASNPPVVGSLVGNLNTTT